MRDRPGFGNFLMRLESIGLQYSLSDIDPVLYRLASMINVQSALFGVTHQKVIHFPSSNIIVEQNSHDATNSILTTETNAFVILKITK